MTRLRELVDQANTLWAPRECPFTSSVPLLGPAIVSLRRAWNWMSAKWYVRPILEQQVTFNSTVVQIINEMCALLEGQGQRLEEGQRRLEEGLALVQRQIEEALQGTSARLGQMEEAQSRRLSELESSLSNQIREAEELTICNDRAHTGLARELARLNHFLKDREGDPQGQLSSLREAVRALEQALAARASAGEGDANSLL